MKYLRFEPLLLLGLIWCFFIANLLLPIELRNFGIRPRDLMGLVGIVFSPLLHSGWQHILANSLPLLVLASLLRLQGKKPFWQVTIFIVLLGGVLVWSLSGAGVVVGASGLIFGYWAFLLTHGFMTQSLKSILIAIVVLFLYGTLFFSLFSFAPHVSWIAHAAGALAGCLAAVYLKPSSR